ncbi:cobalamin-binding protein, partial [SAR202 cluster bacterium AC-647-P02_OGT_505m]|nr:cobalamin-binding protein [SAR202 cluster bacterium AC-647-P02_OGT_505m]
MRICSLLPSTTEIVCALGMETSLVGKTHECDYPP